MFGFFLIYLLGKYFYDFVLEYNKLFWKYVVIGVLSYYLGIVLGGGFMGIMLEWIFFGFVDRINDFLLGLICILFGLLMVKLMYIYL